MTDTSAAGCVFCQIVSRDLARALRRSGLRADGVNVFLADGEAAGQEVWHAHVHVIPRFQGDGFSIDAEAWRSDLPRPPGFGARPCSSRDRPSSCG